MRIRLSVVGLTAAAILALPVAPASAGNAAKIPGGNLVANPTFERGVGGWSGMDAKVKRVRAHNAPNGRRLARVKVKGGADLFTLDDAPATVRRGRGRGVAYTGAAWVKGTTANAGEEVSIVVREWSDGEYVDSAAGSAALKAGKFVRVKTTYKAQKANGEIDVYLERANASRGERFFADAISLVRRGGKGGGGDGKRPPAPVNPSGGLTTSQIAIVSSQEPQLFTETEAKYRYILVRDNLHNRLDDLRRVHPEAELILYKNVGFTQEEPDSSCPWSPYQGGGVSYCKATAHEDWYLHDRQTGARIESDYDDLWAMNIGHPGYQQAWLKDVLARLRDANDDGSGVQYDGVWLDDVNTYPSHAMDGRIAELTDKQYGDATVEFIDAVAPQINAAGFKTIANIGMNPWEDDQRARTLKMAGDLSAINREGLIRWGEGPTWTVGGGAPHWMYEVELAEDIQAAGASFHAITYGKGSDIEAQRYGRATFLLAWNGNNGSAYNYRTLDDGPSWLPAWTVDIGVPTTARYPVGRGWRRDFARGTVVINPAASGSQTFDLGGSFKRPDGSCVNSVTLPATRALVLGNC